ncbi:GNAT family N-acetyltransferase [Virgibacillus sp. W0430]|uniref:GNAT family N-acetyltransferase n=1 Tax=Virgibacillus sp. W0430 TaxID=3391580 RepID=UPI003F484EFB
MDKYAIRKAKLTDAESLEQCMHSAYSKYADRVNVETLPPMRVNYKDEIASFPVWVVEYNTNIIAGVIIVFEKEHASLANIAIHPDYQDKGLGKALLSFVENEVVKKGYSEINLTTHILFTENVLFYKKQGWIQVGNDETKMYMKKYLN